MNLMNHAFSLFRSRQSGVRKANSAKKRGFESFETLENRTLLSASGPVISNLQWIQEPNHVYVITGTVTEQGQSTAGFEVDFGGILSGDSTDTDDNGNFVLVVQMKTGGNFSAETWDWSGDQSNVAMSYLG